MGGALRQWRECAQLVHQGIGGRFEFGVGHTVGGHAPLECLRTWDAPRAHHDVFGAGDADHFLQARRAAGAGDLAELLLGQGV